MGGGGSVQTQPGPASSALATISREDFANWHRKLKPRMTELALEAGNPVTLAHNLDRTSKTIGGQFSEQRMNTTRNLSRMGVTPTAPQMAAMDRQGALAQAGMQVAARNNIRRATRDRDAMIIGGM